MGANNPNYIPSKYFQEGILDKDTGEPLAAGLVYSWADEARTIAKPLYAKVDASPTNNYVALPNPTTLSSIGTFNYCGNDIIPYFYPYDENGNLELYFIDVVSAGGEPQFTRENIPDLSSAHAPKARRSSRAPSRSCRYLLLPSLRHASYAKTWLNRRMCAIWFSTSAGVRPQVKPIPAIAPR